MGSFSYGFDQQSYDDAPQPDPKNPFALGGAVGSQVGSQTGGQGAGITPPQGFSPTYNFAGMESGGITGGLGGAMGGLYTGPVAGGARPPQPPVAPPSKPTGGVMSGGFYNPAGGGYGDSMGGVYTGPPQGGERPAGGTGGTTLTGPGSAPNTGKAAPPQQFQTMLGNIQKASTPQEAAVAHDQLARQVSTSLSDAGHDVKWQDQNTLMVDGRPYTVAGAPGHTIAGGAATTNAMGAGGGGGGAATTNTMPLGQAPAPQVDANDWTSQAMQSAQQSLLPGDLQDWRPTQGNLYTPGEIGFGDIPEFTRESLMNEMEGGQVNQNTNALLNDILKNPTALSDQVVDTLKAQQRNTLSEQQQQEEENMRAFGAASGISDSPWMGSQLLGSQRARDMASAKANQDIDIQAANTRMGDKRAAAQLGMTAGQQHSANVQAAANTSLARAAATGDRLQLRESVKQAAAQMRLSQDQVMSNFVLDKEKNLLQKYGIDLGAQIDAAKLNQASQQFKEDLMFKMHQLDEQLGMQGRQLGSEENRFAQDLQYKYDVFNQGNYDTDWERQWKMTHDTGG